MRSSNWQNGACILVLHAFLAVISGCTPIIKSPDQPTSIIPISTLTAIPVTVSTSTAPSSTITPTSSIAIDKSCLALEEQLPPDIQLTGVWIRQPGKPYLENLDENTKYGIPLDGGGILSVNGGELISPNGRWLAYLDTNYDTSGRFKKATGSTLRVIHSSGRALFLSDWPINFQKIDGWVDDQHLLIELNYFSEVSRQMVMLNPFSGEWEHVDEPDWVQQVLAERRWNEPVVYSPNLKEVILNLEDHSELRDLKTGAILFENREIGFFGDSSWSTDHVLLALTTGKEVYIFQDRVEVLHFDLPNDDVRRLRWSLDHSTLLIETFDQPLVLDVEQRKLFVLCFIDKHIQYDWWPESFLYPVTGEFLVTRIRQEILPNHEVRPFEILIDIRNKHAYKLSESLFYQDRIGWLESP